MKTKPKSFLLLSPIVIDKNKSSMQDTEQTVKCCPREGNVNFAGLHQVFLYHCWLLFFTNLFAQNKGTGKLFQTLSVSAKARVLAGRAKCWLLSPTAASWTLFSVRLTEHMDTTPGTCCGRWPEPHASSMLLTPLVWTPLPKCRWNEKIHIRLS
jgi:hypothetical protein